MGIYYIYINVRTMMIVIVRVEKKRIQERSEKEIERE